MILKRFWAEDFRNIKECDVSFTPGVNLLFGKNAEGKTNAVEGIYIFSRGKSFRASEERELALVGCEGFRLGIEYEDKKGKNTLEYAAFGREKRRIKNGYRLKSVAEMIGSFKSVLFFPDDLGLVKDGPEARRGFLNVAISQCDSTYISYYADYKKAQENKNGILKAAAKGGYFDKEELVCWSQTMAEYASYIYVKRKEYIEKLGPYVREINSLLSGGKDIIEIGYKADITVEKSEREAVKEAYIKRFTENLDREIAAGTTLYGPMRDDIEILISGMEARRFASQGQQRSIVLSMKLAEGEVIKEIFGEYPVFLFDDVLSELDSDRRKYLTSRISDRQIIITSCTDEDVRDIAENVILVEGGKYVSSHR